MWRFRSWLAEITRSGIEAFILNLFCNPRLVTEAWILELELGDNLHNCRHLQAGFRWALNVSILGTVLLFSVSVALQRFFSSWKMLSMLWSCQAMKRVSLRKGGRCRSEIFIPRLLFFISMLEGEGISSPVKMIWVESNPSKKPLDSNSMLLNRNLQLSE